jgi:2'-5' RNA ligase
VIRAFIAFDLDAPTLDALGKMSDALKRTAPLRPAPRWTTRDQVHVTAKFLGATSEAQAGALCDALASIAGPQAPRARITSFGAFPAPARAGVLLATIDDVAGDLARIARATDERAATLGFLREERPFLAHVTFARLRGPVDVRGWIAPIPFAPFDLGVRALTLYKSVLSSAGATYTPLASALFAST